MLGRILWALLCAGCVWSALFSVNAVVIWRAQGDSRANLCAMLAFAFGLGVLMTGREMLRKR